MECFGDSRYRRKKYFLGYVEKVLSFQHKLNQIIVFLSPTFISALLIIFHIDTKIQCHTTNQPHCS